MAAMMVKVKARGSFVFIWRQHSGQFFKLVGRLI
jgi:hypothetical protein